MNLSTYSLKIYARGFFVVSSTVEIIWIVMKKSLSIRDLMPIPNQRRNLPLCLTFWRGMDLFEGVVAWVIAKM